MGGYSMLPLKMPKIDIPQVSYRIIPPDPPPEAFTSCTNSDHSIKQLKKYGYYPDKPCELPSSYIRWIQPTEDELEKRCEYDMDDQDLEWLQALNADRKKLSHEPVTFELFEIAMDRLEKEWFRLNQRLQKPDSNLIPSEDSRCVICEDGDTENSNAIVFCDGCNLAVHQDCYGVPYIPEGQWLCRKCTVSPDRPVACELCPNSFGAFKQTAENKWAHLVCAIHIPETGVGNAMYMEPIDGVRCIPKQRWKLKCYLCKKNVGACVQCANRSCCVAYHVTCAQEFGLYVKMRPSSSLHSTSNSRDTAEGLENQSIDHAGAEITRLSQSFCDKHTPKGHIEALQSAARARLATSNLGTAETSDPSSSKCLANSVDQSHLLMPQDKAISLNDLRALKLLAAGPQTFKSARAYRKSYSSGPPLVPELIFQRVMEYTSKLRCYQRKQVLNMICKYWSLKREARRGAPLLKRLHVEPWTAANPSNCNSEEDRRRKYGLLVGIRHDLQRVQNLAAMVCQREKVKLRKAELQKEAIEKTLFPIYPRMSHILNVLIDVDKHKYFMHPVAAADVPDYYDVIRRPMNWTAIQRKIDRHEYLELNEFISDIYTTLTNARLYNHASSTYHKAAIRIGKAIEPLLHDLITHQPPSAIAGLSSKSFPTDQQSLHFREISSLLTDQINDLLDVNNTMGLASRTYGQLLQDRKLKRSQQIQTHSLTKPLPPIVDLSPIASSEPAHFASGHGEMSGFQKRNDLSHNKPLQSHNHVPPRNVATCPSNLAHQSSFPRGAQCTTETVAPVASQTPSAEREAPLTINASRKRVRKGRGRPAIETPDSMTERPTKRAAPRVKPQSQLEEEALIVQQNPTATKEQLISLKLRAFHAKQIAAREAGMSEAEKARRQRNRDQVRRRRQLASQAKLLAKNSTSNEKSLSSDHPEFSNSNTNHTSQLCAKDLTPIPPQDSCELAMMALDGCAPGHANISNASPNDDLTTLHQDVNTLPSSLPVLTTIPIHRPNSQNQEEKPIGIDKRSDDDRGPLYPFWSTTSDTGLPTPAVANQGAMMESEMQGISTVHRFDNSQLRIGHQITQTLLSPSEPDRVTVQEAAVSVDSYDRCSTANSSHQAESVSETCRADCRPHHPEEDLINIMKDTSCCKMFPPLGKHRTPSRGPGLTSVSLHQIGLDPYPSDSPLYLFSDHVESNGGTIKQSSGLTTSSSQSQPTHVSTPRQQDGAQVINKSNSRNFLHNHHVSEFTLTSKPIYQHGTSGDGRQLDGSALVTATCRDPMMPQTISPISPITTLPQKTTAIGATGVDEPETYSNITPIELAQQTETGLVNQPLPEKRPIKMRIKFKTRESSSLPSQAQPLISCKSSEGVLPGSELTSGTPKLRLILDNSRNKSLSAPAARQQQGSCTFSPPQLGQEEAVSSEAERFKSKVSKNAAGYVGPPEFVQGLPGDKDSFRFFNTGFILPEGTTRRHPHAASMATNQVDVPRRESIYSRSNRLESASPKMKLRNLGVSDHIDTRSNPQSLKPVRLTLIHNPPHNQDSVQHSSSPLVSDSAEIPCNPDQSDLRKDAGNESSSSIGRAESGPGDESINQVNSPSDLSSRSERRASKSFKSAKKPRHSKGLRAEELEVDAHGFLIYPKAGQNSSKNRIHPLAQDAFRRLGEFTRVPEEGDIPDGTLVWAKVAGHNWFPAEVGLPDHPLVPQSVLEKKFNGKPDNHLLLMFFDHERTWQWVLRRNTRYFGESSELDALLASDAYVTNKSKLAEIQAGCAFARANIALPEDVAAEDEERQAWSANQQSTSTHQQLDHHEFDEASDNSTPSDQDSNEEYGRDTENFSHPQSITRGREKKINAIEETPPLERRQTRSSRLRALDNTSHFLD